MSSFLTVDGKGARLDDLAAVASEIFEFKTDVVDFLLARTFSWQEITSMVYFFKLGNEVFQIPSGMYIVLTDEFGSIDCMMVDEIIGRDVEILCMNAELNNIDNASAEVLDAKNKKHFWPNSNNIIPVTSESGKRVVLLSRVDQFKAVKDMTAYDLIG
jgi:hypothetical protein